MKRIWLYYYGLIYFINDNEQIRLYNIETNRLYYSVNIICDNIKICSFEKYLFFLYNNFINIININTLNNCYVQFIMSITNISNIFITNIHTNEEHNELIYFNVILNNYKIMNYVYNMNNIKKHLKTYNCTPNFIIQQILEQIQEIDRNNEIIIII